MTSCWLLVNFSSDLFFLFFSTFCFPHRIVWSIQLLWHQSTASQIRSDVSCSDCYVRTWIQLSLSLLFYFLFLILFLFFRTPLFLSFFGCIVPNICWVSAYESMFYGVIFLLPSIIIFYPWSMYSSIPPSPFLVLLLIFFFILFLSSFLIHSLFLLTFLYLYLYLFLFHLSLPFNLFFFLFLSYSLTIPLT